MTNAKSPDVSDALLKEQIEGFTNFDRELTAGASAKTMMAEIKAKSRDLWQIKPSDIVVLPGFNPRVQNQIYFEGVAALGQDMVNHGYMQDKPLAGYIAKIDGADSIVLQDGHRRLAAVLWANEHGAKIDTVPMVLKDRSQSMVDLTVSLLHSNEGAPFTTYEKAVLAKRLKGYGWENKKIAAEMRCTAAFVGQLLDLAGSPEAIQQMVRDGKMSASHALDVVKAHGEKAVSVAEASVATAKSKGKTKTTAKDVADPAVRKAKALGHEFYLVCDRIFRSTKIVEAMPNTVYEELDRLMTAVEVAVQKAAAKKEPKVPKVKKVKTPKAAKAPKAPKPIKVKKTPLAKKVAGAAKKTAPWDKPSGGTEARASARGK